MSHLNFYSQRGCFGCKPCERGAANVGRSWTLFTIALFTAGVGLLFLPFYRKCLYCGHNTWWNTHYGPDQHSAPVPQIARA